MKTGSLSLSVRAVDIPPGGQRFRVEASEPERLALAAELGIPEVTELSAELDVRPLGARAFTVRGALSAKVVQTDVVTLEPLAQVVSEAIDLTLTPAEEGEREAAEPGESEAPDFFHGGRIALGALTAEHLALGLDPYPRAPGVEFAGHIEDVPSAEDSPLAALAKWKKDEG